MDGLLTLGVALSFGLWVTVHLVLIGVLWRTALGWRAALCLLAPPAVPVLALRFGRRWHAALWGLCGALYLTALMLAR